MDFKDWILLVAPIAFNGIILFLFQQIYLSRIKKNERTNTYKQDTLKEFLSLLQEFYTYLRDIRTIDSERSGKEYEFSSLWNPTAKSMESLVVFYDTHPVTIGASNLSFEKCINEWNSMNDLLFESLKNNNGKISPECSKTFSLKYKKINILVKKCMARCEEEIIN